MLVIRLRRTGKKNKPSYRIVVAEHTMPVNGRFTDDLGFYNPHTKEINLDKEKTQKWLSNGAKPSNSVAKLLLNEKVKHNSVVVLKKNKKSKQEPKEKAPVAPQTEEVAVDAEATPAEEVSAEETTVEETPSEEEKTEEAAS